MSDVEGPINLLKSEIGPDMDSRYADKALYYAVLDAVRGKSDLELVGRNVFRADESRPVVDDFILDEEVVLSILRRLNRREPV